MSYAPEADDEIGVPATGIGIQEFVESDQRDVVAAGRRSSGGVFGLAGSVAALGYGATVGLIDTVASSVGLTDSGDITGGISRGFASATGLAGVNDWYDNNRGAIDIGAGISSVIVADGLAARTLAPASYAAKTLGSSRLGAKVFNADRKYAAALAQVESLELRSAMNAAIGSEFRTASVYSAEFIGPTKFQTVGAARNAFQKTAIQQGTVRNALTEVYLAAGANSNEFLFSGDLGDNLVYAGLGIVGGGLIDAATSRYAIKKIANSETVNRASANALDPYGTEEARIQTWAADLYGKDSVVASIGFGRDRHSDLATSYALSAAESVNEAAAAGKGLPGLFGTRRNIATQFEEQVNSEVNKISVFGFDGVQGTGFAMSHPTLGRAVKHAIYKDPTAIYGVGSLATPREGMTAIETFKLRDKALESALTEVSADLNRGGRLVDSTKKDPKTGVVSKVKKVKAFTPEEAANARVRYRNLVYQNSADRFAIIDGERVSVETASLFDNYKPEKAIKESIGADYSIWSIAGREAGSQLGVSSRLEVFTPRNNSIRDLTFSDSLDLYSRANAMVDHFAATGKRLTVPKEPTWFQLDIAEELIKRSGGEQNVIFANGLTREQAKAQSFKLKVAEIGKEMQDADPLLAQELRYRYNLPRNSAYESGLYGEESHPIEVLLRGMADSGKIESFTYDDILDGIRQSRQLNKMNAEVKDRADDTVGNMFRFNKDNKGKDLGVVLATARPLNPHQWTKEDLAERLAIEKSHFIGTLSTPTAPEFVRTIQQRILADPNVVIAGDVGALREAQAGSQGLVSDFISKGWRDRMNSVMQAAYGLQNSVNRLSRGLMQQAVEKRMGPILAQVTGPRNQASALMTARALSFLGGWDLKTKGAAKVIQYAPESNGLQSLLLDTKSESNRRRWRQAFGTEMPDNARAPAPDGKTLVLDGISKSYLENLNAAAVELLKNKNAIRQAKGLSPIPQRPFYVPPPNIKGKYVGFTLDAMRNVVPNGTVIASSESEFAAKIARLSDSSDPFAPIREGSGNSFFKQQELADFDDLWDQAQMNLIDPGTTPLQGGRQSQGKLLGRDYNPEAIVESMNWLRDSYLALGRDVLQTNMSSAIKAAQARAEVTRPLRANLRNENSATDTNTIFTNYLQNIRGQANIDSPGSIVGKTSRSWEARIDSFLASKAGGADRVFAAAREFVSRSNPGKVTKAQQATFDNLASAMGPHMPFKSVAEMMEREYGIKSPLTSAELSGKLSQFEAFMRLRMDALHGVLNMAGIVAGSPAVIRSMQAMPSESAVDHLRRIGQVGSGINSQAGSLGFLDGTRLMISALREAWDVKNHANYDRWQREGLITQEVAEFQKQMGVAKTRGDWGKKIFGDPHGRTPMQQRGLTGTLAYLSDKSEDLSRSWAHIAGYKLGQHLGIPSEGALDNFAHEFANKTIANYDPLNRPTIFQGALGAPVGLFQSFAWNYYERIFGYIESGNKRALATQFAVQSAIFGVKSVPGFNEFNALIAAQHDGKEDITDGLYNNLDPALADLAFGGGISSLPKLIGAPGIDLSTRGDANFRVPGFQGIPILDSVSRAGQGLGAAIDAFSSSNPNLTTTQLAEILTNTITNRPIAGFIEQTAAGGFDTDFNGQLVTDTQGALEATYRVLGTRSLRQSKEITAFYANNKSIEMQGVKLGNLRNSYRSAIRAGEIPDPDEYFAQYILAGGDEKRYPQWLRSNQKAASKTRATRQAEKFNKSGQDPELLDRLLDMGVEIEESDAAAREGNPYRGAVETPEMPAEGESITYDNLPIE